MSEVKAMMEGMSQEKRNSVDGIRGYFEDAAGHRWTVGIDLVVSALVMIWWIQWIISEVGEMPLSAGESALRRLGLELPDFLQQFINWVSNGGEAVALVLFCVTLLLVLRNSYQSFGNLYGALSWISLMVLFQATGRPWASFIWLLLALAGISVAAQINSWIVRNFSAKDSSERGSYFGERPPLLVFVQCSLGLIPPLMLIMAVAGVVRRAFSFGDDEPFRLSRSFAKQYEEMQENNPEAAADLKVNVLLRAAELDHLSLEMKMIVDHVLMEPTPRGAVKVGPTIRPLVPPHRHSMELALRNNRRQDPEADKG